MSKGPEWTKTCQAFRRIAAREGVSRIAEEVPADPATIYRLIRGDTGHPTRAVRAGIERIVQEHTELDP